MSRPLPDQPSLEHLKHEAKALVKAHKQGDPSICQTLRHVPRLRDCSDSEVLAAEVSLQEAQHALAQTYGFRGWKALSDHVVERSDLAREVAETAEMLAVKGPPRDSTGSDWEKKRYGKVFELARAGEHGIKVLTELVQSDNGRVREAAALALAHADDPRLVQQLRPLLEDPKVKVRMCMLRAWAVRLHPDPELTGGSGWILARKAESVPNGIELLTGLLADANWRIRREAVCALAAYADLGDQRVDQALRGALEDGTHAVQHAAARAMATSCPGCGQVPKQARQP